MTGSDPVARLMFGAALRAHRTQAGMSLRDLGRAVHYDHSRLSRAENGEHLPGLGYVRSIDAALGTGNLLATLHGLAEQPSPPHPDLDLGSVAGPDDPQPATVELHLPDGRVTRVSISRRQLVELLAAGGVLALAPTDLFNADEAHNLRRALDRPREVDARVAGYFARLLNEHYTADKMLGPADLLPVAHAELATVDRLRRDAKPDVRRLLAAVQCQYAEFLGWLYQDAGDPRAAMYYSDRAAELAQTTGDRQMTAYLLIRKSNIAYRAGDADLATELAAAAHRDRDGVDPKILALACQQEARGWAIARDYDHCQRRLDQAAITSRTPDPPPPGRRPTSTTTEPTCWKTRPRPATATLAAPSRPSASSGASSTNYPTDTTATGATAWPNSPSPTPTTTNPNPPRPSACKPSSWPATPAPPAPSANSNHSLPNSLAGALSPTSPASSMPVAPHERDCPSVAAGRRAGNTRRAA